jgi:predicted RNA binding protein YcfA (HicA-like mRNA interferase family)
MPRIFGVNHQDALRALQKAGFVIVRQGKHIVMRKGERFRTILRHNPIKAFTMGGIVGDAGLTVEQFKALL